MSRLCVTCVIFLCSYGTNSSLGAALSEMKIINELSQVTLYMAAGPSRFRREGEGGRSKGGEATVKGHRAQEKGVRHLQVKGKKEREQM